MIKQIQSNQPHQETKNPDVMGLKSHMISSNIIHCHICNKTMHFVEGDIIFGERWYHNDCWKLVKENV